MWIWLILLGIMAAFYFVDTGKLKKEKAKMEADFSLEREQWKQVTNHVKVTHYDIQRYGMAVMVPSYIPEEIYWEDQAKEAVWESMKDKLDIKKEENYLYINWMVPVKR